MKTVQIPLIAKDYNFHMNAVDVGDQLRSQLGFDHRIRRGGWQSIAWTFLLDIALINSYLLQRRAKPAWQPFLSQAEWRQQICDSLIRAYSEEAPKRQKFRAGNEVVPISQHNHVPRGKRAQCVACKGKRIGERAVKRRPLGEARGDDLNQRRPGSWTDLGCDVCELAICNSKYCWDFYHKLN